MLQPTIPGPDVLNRKEASKRSSRIFSPQKKNHVMSKA
jgi:hypothetical protein